MSDSVPDPSASLGTKVARGVAWSGAAQAVIAIGDIVSLLVVMKLMPVKHFGIAAMAFPFYTMLDTVADLGITASLIQRDDHTPERVSTVFWVNIMISAGLLLLLLGLGPLYGWLVGFPVVGWLLVAYGGKLIFQNVYTIPFALLRKELRFSEIAIARVVAHLAESTSRIVLVLLGVTIWCFTFSAFVRAVVFGAIMQLRHPFLPRWVFRPREVIQFVRFGLRSAGSQVLYQLYANLDYPIVGYFFGPTANGIYTAASSIVLQPVRVITNVVSDVAFPTFARLRGDRPVLADQFIRFTRLNLITVVPFVVLILLVIPEFLQVFFAGKNWEPGKVHLVSDAAYILCIVGVLRALGFLGPPLLDGIGHPERTLRYMIVAAIAVPGTFVLGATVLGDRLNLLSVAVAWAVGYPLAFAVLAWLVVKGIDLSLRTYVRRTWGIVACCAAGFAVGTVVSFLMAPAAPGLRMLVVAGSALAVILGLFATTQNVSPRSITRALKG
jgi:O-antigen/teichoic acid export membrane protein